MNITHIDIRCVRTSLGNLNGFQTRSRVNVDVSIEFDHGTCVIEFPNYSMSMNSSNVFNLNRYNYICIMTISKLNEVATMLSKRGYFSTETIELVDLMGDSVQVIKPVQSSIQHDNVEHYVNAIYTLDSDIQKFAKYSSVVHGILRFLKMGAEIPIETFRLSNQILNGNIKDTKLIKKAWSLKNRFSI